MFDGKYSKYSSEQIMIPKYKELCSKFLSLPLDENIKEQMKRNTLWGWI